MINGRRYDSGMQPLTPEQLAKFEHQFRSEALVIAQGQTVAQQITLGLAQTGSTERATVLEALANDVVRNLNQYRIEADLSLLAWSTRNIFELETILAFVTASPENMKRFVDDIVLDEIQIREAGQVLNFDRSDPEIARRQDEALERLRRRKADLGIKRDRPTTTGEMARAIGPERYKEYQAFNKLYSKTVHPTAYLLMGGNLESTNWSAYRLHVMLQGVRKAALFHVGWSSARK